MDAENKDDTREFWGRAAAAASRLKTTVACIATGAATLLGAGWGAHAYLARIDAKLAGIQGQLAAIQATQSGVWLVSDQREFASELARRNREVDVPTTTSVLSARPPPSP